MPIGVGPYPWSVLPDRQWEALYQANAELIDDILADLRRLADGARFAELTIAAYLPPTHLARYDEGFLRKFLVCVVAVGEKLRLPDFHPLSCTAEELAVYAMKVRAGEILDEEDGEERDFGTWDDCALDDADHELLYAPALDGIEELPQLKPMALAHLPFDEWFLPFNPSRPVHPYLSSAEDMPWEADRALFPVTEGDDKDGDVEDGDVEDDEGGG